MRRSALSVSRLMGQPTTPPNGGPRHRMQCFPPEAAFGGPAVCKVGTAPLWLAVALCGALPCCDEPDVDVVAPEAHVPEEDVFRSRYVTVVRRGSDRETIV